MSTFSRVVPLSLCLLLAACAGNQEQGGRFDYARAKTLPPLDVPPPMAVPAEGSDAAVVPVLPGAESDVVLPGVTGAQVVRSGEERWLVVDRNPDDLWVPIREFLVDQGFEITHEDRRTGILETQWAENRADIPESFIRGLISRVAPKIYSAGTRDKYRVRLERGQSPGVTEIFVTHYGVQQVQQGESTVWQPRPSDPELTAELLTRLMLAVGVPEQQANAQMQAATTETAPRAQLQGDTILVGENFARTWRRVGLALDRIGLAVEDLDRSQGLYWVRVSEEAEQGWIDSLFSDEPDITDYSLRVKVVGSETTSRVTLEGEEGKPVAANVRQELLSRLQEELR